MLEIVGSTESKELDAANKLCKLLVSAEPDILDHHAIRAYLLPSVQCYRQNPRDVDLVLMLWDQRMETKVSKTSSGALIRSLCLTIEVKGHSSKEVSFIGKRCHVKYHGDDHDVSLQSEKQKYSLLEFLKKDQKQKFKNKPRTPWIDNIIWLTNVPKSAIPSNCLVLGSDSSWLDLLDLIEALQPRISPKSNAYKGFLDLRTFEAVKATLVDKIKPSRIDRRKMEIITKNNLRQDQGYTEKIGNQLIILRGRGGTGKTVRLLRMAYKFYTEKQSRVLILTYNKALVSDITRLISLLKLKDSLASQSVSIRTIHSFLYEWLKVLDAMKEEPANNFLTHYPKLKGYALELLKAGAITREDIQERISQHSRTLAWDIIMIDESQDWPEDERDMLYDLYGAEKFVLADGVDQLVRGTKLINWRENLPRSMDSQVVTLRKSLRLKSELCNFVIKFAEKVEYANWDLEPVPESHGGKVIVYTGDPFNPDILASVLSASEKDGNKNVDNLICVPPAYAKKESGGQKSLAAHAITQWGYLVWDGVSATVRDEFPKSLDELRVVQYDSCRGLEGWAVINIGLDEFFEFKQATADIDDKAREDMFFNEEEANLDFAKRWLMIPMTRAVDTLVIHITNPKSYIGQALMNLHEVYPDEIDWISP